MEEKIRYVDQVLGFLYVQGFAHKFRQVGAPPEDLEVWYRNAQVYEKVTRLRQPRQEERIKLVTLIESVRIEAMVPPLPGEPHEFDVSVYEFSEDVLAYKQEVVDEILAQEAREPSTLSGF